MGKHKKTVVLHITQVQGGIQTYIEQIYKNIDKDRFELEIACPKEQESLIQFAVNNNIKWHPLKLKWRISPFSDVLSVLRIIRLVKKTNPNIIHAHSSKAGFVTRMASVFIKPTVLYTPHAYAFLSGNGLKEKAYLCLEKLARPFTDVLLACSKSEYNRSVKDVKFSPSKISVFQNSIDIPTFTKVEREHTETPIITTVGRLVFQKNPLMFLQVCKLLKDNNVNAKFQIIGAGFDDKMKEEVDLYMKKNNLHDSIKVFNWINRQDLIEKIRHTDVFVMTSVFESFGYVAAEAQALEIPVVCTNVDGLNEIVIDKETGFLVDTNDVEKMAEKISWLLENSEAAKEMGKAGRLHILNKFNILNNINILENIYQKHAKDIS